MRISAEVMKTITRVILLITVMEMEGDALLIDFLQESMSTDLQEIECILTMIDTTAIT
jgi:hypothetical protein